MSHASYRDISKSDRSKDFYSSGIIIITASSNKIKNLDIQLPQEEIGKKGKYIMHYMLFLVA